MAVSSTVLVPASLYVGDLHPDTKDEDLLEAFSGTQGLCSVRVCRDAISGRSLGYGYVNYFSQAHATNAIEQLNHTLLRGRPIRIMWSDRDPDARKSGIGNLFVKNLEESVDNVKLHDIFSKFGSILSCKVSVTSDGKSRGYGFVQFESEKCADAAIENLNGTMIGEKQIFVGNFIKKSERILHNNADVKYTNLYIKNIDPDVTEELLSAKFSEFGKIVNLVISKGRNGNSKGFGFVNFESHDDAKSAMEAMNGGQLGSKILYVARAQKKAEREKILHNQFQEKRKEQMQKSKGSNVYVKNIDDSVRDEDLQQHFSQCGNIISVKLMRDEKGISKGFGFVCFSTPEEANRAVSTLQGNMFHQKPLYLAIAQRKEDRKAHLQMQFAQRTAGLAGPTSAVIPVGYPPLYYAPTMPQPLPGVAQLSPKQGLIYQPMGLQPGWRSSGFPPVARASLRPIPVSVIPNVSRQPTHSHRRVNGLPFTQNGQNMPFIGRTQPTNPSSKETSATGQMYSSTGQNHDDGSESIMASTASNTLPRTESEMLSSRLAAASPQHQKQILGDCLFPLVKKLKLDLAAKITGMLLEMDNSELLLLLESPGSLAAKVEEAISVLELSKVASGAGGQDTLHAGNSYLSAEVAVN